MISLSANVQRCQFNPHIPDEHPPLKDASGTLQLPLAQLLILVAEESPTEALNAEKSFLFLVELHSGQETFFWFTEDLCSTSNLVLHSEHLYSNKGISNLL
jgi:hypothetical protein